MKSVLLKTLLPLAWLMWGLTACDSLSHNIGSLTFPIEVRTTMSNQPVAGALVYVVQNTEWIAKNLTLEKFANHKSDYLINSGLTPITLHLPAYQYVVIVEWNGKLHKLSNPVVPGTDQLANLELAIP